MTTDAAAAPALSPLLQGFLDQLAAVRRDTAALTDGIGDARFGWAPGPGRWSMGQNANHLTLTGRSYVPAIAAVLADARARGRADRGDYRHSWIGKMLVRSMEPPPRMRFKAPKPWRPADPDPAVALDRTHELAELERMRDGLEAQIRAAAGLDLRRTRIASPVSPLLRMNVGDAFALLLAHERRHLWQMRQITREPGYPAG